MKILFIYRKEKEDNPLYIVSGYLLFLFKWTFVALTVTVNEYIDGLSDFVAIFEVIGF